ncbi:DUF2141 domain-containing protein [Aquimarina sp. ERC-38]|uniref:DUF2141 domain-containing protein n=1 Tax=Aquimarina sp. ERC-38 TaxID=2949996 RepID=UPI0022465112|nr:DUF2141 domain-containing protein [Aquimarina sp. ERC-38]UZO80346.1 DUF2141 domain-containing protein [Aquimarina sp. ERC-38]
MKSLFIFLIAFTLQFTTNAQNASGTTITVTIPNVTSSEGTVQVGLYDEQTFMKAAPIQGEIKKIENGKVTVTFEDVAPGTYAISCYHDKNNNNQMDFEPTGMPKESYGISNNPMSYGPPNWSEAKFEVSGDPITMEIRM